MDDLLHLYNKTETQWIAAKMVTRQMLITEYFAVNEGP
jgi:hypothetical protein